MRRQRRAPRRGREAQSAGPQSSGKDAHVGVPHAAVADVGVVQVVRKPHGRSELTRVLVPLRAGVACLSKTLEDPGRAPSAGSYSTKSTGRSRSSRSRLALRMETSKPSVSSFSSAGCANRGCSSSIRVSGFAGSSPAPATTRAVPALRSTRPARRRLDERALELDVAEARRVPLEQGVEPRVPLDAEDRDVRFLADERRGVADICTDVHHGSLELTRERPDARVVERMVLAVKGSSCESGSSSSTAPTR